MKPTNLNPFRNKEVSQRLFLELGIFLYLSFSLITSVADEIYGWVGIWYAADYSIGFSSRLIVGSFLHLLFGNYITQEVAYNFIIVCFVIIFALLAKSIGYAYQKISTIEGQWAVILLAGIYLASPAAPGYLWTTENMGRLETYLFLLSLVIFLCAVHIKKDLTVILISTLLAVLCIAIHQVYMFLFLPLVLVIFIYHVYATKFQRNILVPVLFSVVLLCGVCIFFQFGTQVNFTDSRALTDYLQTKTSIFCDEGPIIQEYFWPFSKHFTENYLPDMQYRLRYGVVTVFLLSPILIVLACIWYKTLNHCQNKYERSKYYLILMTNLTFVPAFAILTDWGRWFAAYFTIQFLVLFYLICKKDEHIIFSIHSLGSFAKEYLFIFIGIILYLGCFEKFEGCNYLNQAESFFRFAYQVFRFIFPR